MAQGQHSTTICSRCFFFVLMLNASTVAQMTCLSTWLTVLMAVTGNGPAHVDTDNEMWGFGLKGASSRSAHEFLNSETCALNLSILPLCVCVWRGL